MNKIHALFAFVMWICVASAKNETLAHGWVAEPDGRGTWSIVWSCLATVFICTWTILHLDVLDEHGLFYLFIRKVSCMFLVALAPEVRFASSAANFTVAKLCLRWVRENNYKGWEMAHMQFIYGDGLHLRNAADQDQTHRCDLQTLLRLIESGTITGPPITAKELQSRSKGDWIAKLLALTQISWFGAEILVRAIMHFQITALEIMTVAFLVCSFFTYGFCLQRPQNIEYPITIDMQNANLFNDLQNGGRTELHGHEDPEALSHEMTNIDAERILSQPSPPEDASLVMGVRAPPPLASTFTNICKDIEHQASRSSTFSPLNLTSAIRTRSGLLTTTLRTRSGKDIDDTDSDIMSLMLFTLFASAFGAVHCLGWNSPFPTPQERLAWRICSVATTSMPLLGVSLVALAAYLGEHMPSVIPDDSWIVLQCAAAVVMVLYVVGRITIIVLAFMALRALPIDAFQTVDWSNYIPHYSA